VLQARLCEARGIPVYELSPALPQLGPNRLEVGPSALEAARSYSERALAAPARGVRVHGGDR
jgi:hypothetical protein